MADYKINFKRIGKQASGIRQKVLQAQKGDKKGGITTAGTRETLTSLKTLNSSILKLIASNKDLSNSIKGGARGAGGGGGPGGGGIGVGGGSAGFGRIGAAIPVLGAGIAALGFTIQKVNQIGNAYIAKTSQQLGNVGIGGFRGAKGLYTGAELGAGMRAYGMSTGRFSRGVTPERSALNMSTIFGQTTEESLRTAGQFRRAGANYEGAVFAGAGAGIESELPLLLTGMSSILTDAVREGVNTSDMSKDMAREISAITMATPGKSVEAALNMVKGFAGVKKQIAGGKMGTYQGLEMTKASQQILLEKLTKSDYASKLMERGAIDEETFSKLTKLKQGATFSDLMSAAGGAAFPMLRRTTEETGTPQLMKQVRKNILKQYGEGPKARDRFSEIALQTGWAGLDTQSKIDAFLKTGDLPTGLEGKGKGIISKEKKIVERSVAATGKRREVSREQLIMNYGDNFAKASVKMEEAMIKLAKEAAPLAVEGIKAVGAAANTLSKGIDLLNKKIQESTSKKSGFSLMKFLGMPSLFNTE